MTNMTPAEGQARLDAAKANDQAIIDTCLGVAARIGALADAEPKPDYAAIAARVGTRRARRIGA